MIEIENGQTENVEAVADHGRLKRLLAHHHLDHLTGVKAGVADHPDDAVIGFDINHERVGDERDPRSVVQIVGPIDLSRHVHFDDQGAGAGTLDGDGLDLGAFQQLVAKHRGKLATRRRLGGERGDLPAASRSISHWRRKLDTEGTNTSTSASITNRMVSSSSLADKPGT